MNTLHNTITTSTDTQESIDPASLGSMLRCAHMLYENMIISYVINDQLTPKSIDLGYTSISDTCDLIMTQAKRAVNTKYSWVTGKYLKSK